MKKFLNLSAVLLIIITLTAAGSDKKKPKNLILFIGDGMGVAQVYAGMTSSGFTHDIPGFSRHRFQHYIFSKQLYNGLSCRRYGNVNRREDK